ncbi:MAG: amidohydrolase family protein [Gammaproteobacteria bacterium]|nr:amidohydrolase family protein [Gammaproteobacteria bacterium]
MSIFDEPKIDCHAHIFDPTRFPYQENNPFHPGGGETGTVEQLGHVMRAYGVRHVLLVQPNSGYGTDNSYLLQAISESKGRFKGMAKIPHDISLADLKSLKSRGVLGAAINPTFDGLDYYRDAGGLIERLSELEMIANIQVENADLLMFMPWLREFPVRVVIDHCGRPAPGSNPDRPEYQALRELAETQRSFVKISGFAKFSTQGYPFDDIHPHLQSIMDIFTPQRCLWASDWPFLRSPQRQDYGPLIKLMETFFPDAADRRAVFWDNPRRLFGFGT